MKHVDEKLKYKYVFKFLSFSFGEHKEIISPVSMVTDGSIFISHIV
jgi:hypothetical protein